MLGHPVPILRSFDEAKALDFYVGFLGFEVDWRHRFEDGMPLYMQLSRGGCVLHLSEHHGDATPGSAIRVPVADVDRYHSEVSAKGYAFARPAVEEPPWGGREFLVGDPFGNRLTFFTPPSSAGPS